MLELKQYQKNALSVLTQFLQACRSVPVADAFHAVLATQNRSNERYHTVFDEVPCICLRIPTGGGKTLLAAHGVALAGKAVLDSDAPLALWLTPSDTIRTVRHWHSISATVCRYVIWKACKLSARMMWANHASWWWQLFSRSMCRIPPSATCTRSLRSSHRTSTICLRISAQGWRK
jgi:hypothetical protein